MQPMVPFTILRLAEVQGILPRKPKGGLHWKGKVKEGDRIEKVGTGIVPVPPISTSSLTRLAKLASLQ